MIFSLKRKALRDAEGFLVSREIGPGDRFGLFWRLRSEDLAASRLGFWFGLRSFLGFFATFVFASHV